MNEIYCDMCGDQTSFQDATAGLDKHNVATCFDCLKKLDKKKEDEQLAQRLREKRRERINRAYNSIDGD